MSLQETSALPPNTIVDKRTKGIRVGGCSSARRRLSQLTERAVDEALKLQAESGRLVDVVDIQSCGDPGEFWHSIKYPFYPLASKLLPSSSSRSCAVPKQSQDRHAIAAKIYSLLIRWRSDSTFEWRARVALAVPVVEEALYRMARCKEDYTSQQLLESHLKHALLHFEAGNGLFLLQGTNPLYPVQAHHGPSSTCHNASSQMDYVLSSKSCKISPRDAFPCESAEILPTNDSNSASDPGCHLVNYAMWDAVELGHPNLMEHKNRDNPGKRIAKRVVSMLSKRRADDNARLRHELRRASAHSENTRRAGVRGHGAKEWMQSVGVGGDGESCDTSRIEQESSCGTRTRTSSRKTLGDLINLTNGCATEGSLMTNRDEIISFMNEESNCLSPCPKRPDKVHLFCTNKVEPMKIHEKRPFTSSSHVADAEDAASIEQTLQSSDKANQSTDQKGSGEVVAYVSMRSSSSSPSSSTASMMSVSTSPLASASSLVHERIVMSISSPNAKAALQHRQSPSASTTLTLCSAHTTSASAEAPPSSISFVSSSSSSSLSSISHTSYSSALSRLPHISLPPLQPIAPSLPTPSSSIRPLHRPLHSSTLLEEEHHQRQQVSATSYAPSTQMPVTPQEPEIEALSSSTASDGSSPAEVRERGVRLPLSIFLAERDEYDVNGMVGISDDDARPWDTWEEPTEQMDPLCCVCMVGLKGAALIPCGHTFCRKCSRELRRGRGACPLCNRYIREILDVY